MSTLTLQTAQRHNVDINGVKYFLRSAGEFSFQDYYKFRAIGERLQKLDFNNPKDARKIMQHVNRFIGTVLLAPKKIRNSLTDASKVEVINFFLAQQEQESPKKNTL